VHVCECECDGRLGVVVEREGNRRRLLRPAVCVHVSIDVSTNAIIEHPHTHTHTHTRHKKISTSTAAAGAPNFDIWYPHIYKAEIVPTLWMSQVGRGELTSIHPRPMCGTFVVYGACRRAPSLVCACVASQRRPPYQTTPTHIR
jgi:hypothetical protein